jgi:curli biogenesis system outer membrane secretion channel CsgG
MTEPAALTRPPAGALHWSRRSALRVGLAAGAAMASAAWAQTGQSLPAVVVWDFDNQTPPSAAAAERLDFLRRSLSENLTATLLQVPGLPVVERQRLKDLLAEQKVSASELADDDARVRLGRIVGAQRMVFGGYFVLAGQVQVHARVVDSATSRVLFSDEAVAPAAQLMQDVAVLNQRMAQALGGGAPPGRSYSAQSWLAYDQALALADAGQLDQAVDALQRLLGQDKNFTPAERQLVALLEKMARR